MKTNIIIGALLLMLLSCDILRESFFEVLEWSPGVGYHADQETLEVTLTFSHDPYRSSIEKYFSLSADGDPVRGEFFWEGRKMYFYPLVSLENNKDYIIRLSAHARNTKGLSMDWDFEERFSTRSDSRRPQIVTTWPKMDDIMDDSRDVKIVAFSVPVSLNSLRNSTSFNPSISGSWHLEEGGMRAVFTPIEPWPYGRRFEMRVSSSLAGENGITMGKDFVNIFTIGAHRAAPVLESAWRITESGNHVQLISEPSGTYTENTGWEKNDKLKLVFSAAVDLLSVKTALSADNAPALVLEVAPSENPGYSNEGIFRFERHPGFSSRFIFRLRSGIKDLYGNESQDEYFFRIFHNGENSRPPVLIGIRIPMSPGGRQADPEDYQLKAFGIDQLFVDLPIASEYYPYAAATQSWVEYYFDCAPGTSIDPFSLVERFRVETSNNVMHFSPQFLRNSNFTVDEPHPSWEHYHRLEMAGALTNTVNSGLVHFIVNQGLKDSAGNISEKQFRISLIK